MSFINIAGTQPVDDPEYRYKMPRLIAKIEGRGNGIKTLVVNCADIATALHRSTAEVCKFFGCELGAQSKYDKENDRAIVNGAFEAGMMQQHLSKYIEGFVLCPSCRLPETKYKFKGQTISHKCYACGSVQPVDMNHRLTTFILKEHASGKRSDKAVKDKKKDKEKKKKEKASQDEPEKEEAATKSKKKSSKKDKDESSSNGDKEKKSKKSKSSKSKDKDGKSKKEKKDKDADDKEDDDGVVWHTDLSEEAVAARAAEAAAIEAGALAAMQVTVADDAANEEDVVATLDNLEVDDESAIDSVVVKMQAFLAANHSDDEIYEELCRQQTMSMLAITDRLLIFFRAAFTAQILATNQIAKYSGVMEKIVDNKHAQFQLIALCEHFCAVDHPELMPSFPVVLKLLYDEDLLEEECLIEWDGKDVRKEHAHWAVTEEQAAKLSESMKPFIEWLENAEEETDDDDEDDE